MAEGLIHMNVCQYGVPSKEWELPFLAVPERVARLRRTICAPLKLWGVPDLVEAVQLCVTELVTNVITHVGAGTPTWVTMTANEACLRIEVSDTDAEAMPSLACTASTQETGRGLGIVAIVADRWGVIPHEHGKVVWCELGTGLRRPGGQANDPQIVYTEALLTLYGRIPEARRANWALGCVAPDEAATELIADLLHWFHAYNMDADIAFGRAQSLFKARMAQPAQTSGD
ncbi:ATP-binding protein [Streptoverticillium reticulum]|uniref:ATP-binding protein n=1 Tax=Streptoverticillium reticulum TaxID=1433415 RepID=UPI0039BF74E2